MTLSYLSLMLLCVVKDVKIHLCFLCSFIIFVLFTRVKIHLCFLCSFIIFVLFTRNQQRGLLLRGTFNFSFRRVDMTQRVVSRIVLFVCHVRKNRPRGGIQLYCLREIKIVMLCVIQYDALLRHIELDACNLGSV